MERSLTEEVIDISKLEVKFGDTVFEIIDGFWIPDGDLAREDSGATVIECESRVVGCLSEKPLCCTWTESGKPITIRLPQPFCVRKIDVAMYCSRARGYNYIVDTSLDRKDCTQVADRTVQSEKSSEEISFESVQMVYVRIVFGSAGADDAQGVKTGK